MKKSKFSPSPAPFNIAVGVLVLFLLGAYSSLSKGSVRGSQSVASAEISTAAIRSSTTASSVDVEVLEDRLRPQPLLPAHRLPIGWRDKGTKTLMLPGGRIPVTVQDTSFEGSWSQANWWDQIDAGWEPSTFKALKAAQLARPGAHVDSGAWIGPTALYVAQFATLTIAVEPDPFAYEQLSANIELNPKLSPRMAVHRLCLAPQRTVLTFSGIGASGSTSNPHAAALPADLPSFSVTCVPLHSILAAHGIEPGDWTSFKLDVEGAEATLLPALVPLLQFYEWPTLHLSVHPSFWGSDRAIATKLVTIMKLYTYIYDQNLKRMQHGELTPEHALVFTDFTLSQVPLHFD